MTLDIQLAGILVIAGLCYLQLLVIGVIWRTPDSLEQRPGERGIHFLSRKLLWLGKFLVVLPGVGLIIILKCCRDGFVWLIRPKPDDESDDDENPLLYERGGSQ